jgi:hypothetical protein
MLVAFELWELLDRVLKGELTLDDEGPRSRVGLGPFEEPLPSAAEVAQKLKPEVVQQLFQQVDEEVRDWARILHGGRGEVLRLQAEWLAATTTIEVNRTTPAVWCGPPDTEPPDWPDVFVNTKTKQLREQAAREIGRANESSVRDLLRNPRAVPAWAAFMEAMNPVDKTGV